ncbi:hypothetical protein [uncultured Roseibium sp.]|uniref:hypothetical protein n=1 Tax=uncultured Roseibium sp. TaxID=1936171 RepID=UPI003216DDA5
MAVGLLAAASASAGFGEAYAQTRIWTVTGTYAEIVATDCRDCGDDIGILIACRGDGLPARVSVPWLATENGPAGMTLPLEMTIGNQRFVYDATLSNPGQAGHVPEFFMNPHDPALEALMTGRSAQIIFDGVQANIGLQSSRSALSIFKAHCGWNNVPYGAQFANGEPVGSGGSFQPSGAGGQQAPAANPDLSWFANSYPDQQTGTTDGTLTFGIPETDAMVFDALCRAGQGNSAEVRFGVALGTLRDGDPVTLYIRPNGANFEFSGTAFQAESGEFAGMTVQIPLSDPVWQAMSAAGAPFVIGAHSGGEAMVSSEGAAAAIGQFLQTCQSAAGQGAVQGAVQGAPQQPQADLPSQGVPQQPQTQQPLAQQPLVQQPLAQQPQQPQPQQQPPAAIDGSYACSDGSNLLVAVTQLGANEIANVVRNGTEVHALVKQPMEGAGMRFSDGNSNLIAINGILMLTGSQGGASCQKR